jgi:hypothetical protein
MPLSYSTLTTVYFAGVTVTEAGIGRGRELDPTVSASRL